MQRGQARSHLRGGRLTGIEPQPLEGAAAWAATALCVLPVTVGFLLPAVILGTMAAGSGQSIADPRYLRFAGNSLTLAGLAALVTVTGAVLVGFRTRLHPGRASRGLALGAGLGYAVPGGVIAVGLLVPFAGLDNLIDAWARAHLGVSTGLLFTGSIWLLVIAYMVRFMAVALNAFDAGLATVSPAVDAVARTLGRSPPAVLGRVHLPILKGSVMSAFIIVFVDTMKELPATLIMRPFDFDTLAVQAHRLAADERLDAGGGAEPRDRGDRAGAGDPGLPQHRRAGAQPARRAARAGTGRRRRAFAARDAIRGHGVKAGRYRWRIAAALLLASAGAAGAVELAVNIGQDDALDRSSSGTLALGLEVRTDPMASAGAFTFGAGAAVEGDGDGDIWLGAGPYAYLGLPRQFRGEASLMAGAYSRGEGADLGHDVEFRSRLGVSRAVGRAWRVGVAAEHKSNGGVGAINPGVETVFVTFSRRF